MFERFRGMPRGFKIFFGVWGVLAVGFIFGAFAGQSDEADAEEVDLLRTENSELKSQVAELQSEARTLEANQGEQNDGEASVRTEELESKVEELERRVEDLQADKAELGDSLQRVEENLESVQAERDKLKAELATAQEAQEANADEGDVNEATYLAVVKSQTSTFDDLSDEELINIGHGICGFIDKEGPATQDEFLMSLMLYLESEGVGVLTMSDAEIQDVGAIAGASIATYCPEHSHLTE